MVKHKARYRLFDSKCECSCGWIVQANDKADGLRMIASHARSIPCDDHDGCEQGPCKRDVEGEKA